MAMGDSHMGHRPLRAGSKPASATTSLTQCVPGFFQWCRLNKPGRVGMEYVCLCECGILYDIEGYYWREAAPAAGSASDRTSVKLPLPPEFLHPHWVRVSDETFVHVEVVSDFEASFHAMHATFHGVCTKNEFTLQGTHPGAQRSNRQVLYEKRLEAAVLRRQLLRVINTLPPRLRCNVNLKMHQDTLLEQVRASSHAPRWQQHAHVPACPLLPCCWVAS